MCLLTGPEVAPGQRYEFPATGKWQDGWIPPCDPNGWWGGPLQAFNRMPWKRLFLLCGTVGEDDTLAFTIGVEREWVAPAEVAGLTDRRLFLFANDWRSRYHNNRIVPPEKGGPLTVT